MWKCLRSVRWWRGRGHQWGRPRGTMRASLAQRPFSTSGSGVTCVCVCVCVCLRVCAYACVCEDLTSASSRCHLQPVSGFLQWTVSCLFLLFTRRGRSGCHESPSHSGTIHSVHSFWIKTICALYERQYYNMIRKFGEGDLNLWPSEGDCLLMSSGVCMHWFLAKPWPLCCFVYCLSMLFIQKYKRSFSGFLLLTHETVHRRKYNKKIIYLASWKVFLYCYIVNNSIGSLAFFFF